MTVNYGTGTPAMAAAWVTQATATAGQGVAYWEIGNESYGCWEAQQLARPGPGELPGLPRRTAAPPARWQPNLGQAAGMQTMATSYAANAGRT